MKLSRNSWHAKLNNFIYGKYYIEDVDCLCPYFWGTILAIFALPLWLLGRGINRLIYALPIEKIKFPSISDRTADIISKVVGFGFIGFVTTLLTIALVDALIRFGLLYVLIFIGMVIGIIGACIGVIYIGVKIHDKYREWKYNKPTEDKKPNIVVEFIKAKKNKHCPLVQWE